MAISNIISIFAELNKCKHHNEKTINPIRSLALPGTSQRS